MHNKSNDIFGSRFSVVGNPLEEEKQEFRRETISQKSLDDRG